MSVSERTYSEGQAVERVAQLRRHGLWPGMVPAGGGRFRLTCDPDLGGARGRGASPDPGPRLVADSGASSTCPPVFPVQEGASSACPQIREQE